MNDRFPELLAKLETPSKYTRCFFQHLFAFSIFCGLIVFVYVLATKDRSNTVIAIICVLAGTTTFFAFKVHGRRARCKTAHLYVSFYKRANQIYEAHITSHNRGGLNRELLAKEIQLGLSIFCNNLLNRPCTLFINSPLLNKPFYRTRFTTQFKRTFGPRSKFRDAGEKKLLWPKCYFAFYSIERKRLVRDGKCPFVRTLMEGGAYLGREIIVKIV